MEKITENELKTELLKSVYITGLVLNNQDAFMGILFMEISEMFTLKSKEFIISAIKEGRSGKYGISRGFTMQLVMYWIHRKIKEDKEEKRGML